MSIPVPLLESDDVRLQRLHAAAVHNLMVTNAIPALTDSGMIVFRAGGGYPQPWTRDAAINCWNAGSLLAPTIAEATLRESLARTAAGWIIRQDKEWWDQIIWVIAAHHHVLLTGDLTFASDALEAGRATLDVLQQHYDPDLGLYRGGAVMQDGIAGYPEPPFDPTISSTFVDHHPRTRQLCCLSTNAVYAHAIRALTALAHLLGQPDTLGDAATRLTDAINDRFWLADQRKYAAFLLDGVALDYQEGLGDAFVLLFDLAPADRTDSVVAHHRTLPYGTVNVWPHFPRFDDAHPGRHNMMAWPMVMGYWAAAAAHVDAGAAFLGELEALQSLVAGSGDAFFELYDPFTGAPAGGWQNGREWISEPDQTWSATALLRLVHEALLGITTGVDGLRFAPTSGGPQRLRLRNLAYRAAVLDITVNRGTGRHVTSLNGRPVPAGELIIPCSSHGHITVTIDLV